MFAARAMELIGPPHRAVSRPDCLNKAPLIATAQAQQSGQCWLWLRQANPYLVTILIVVVIFYRVPIWQVVQALKRTPL